MCPHDHGSLNAKAELTPQHGGQLVIRVRKEGSLLVLEAEHDGHMSPEDFASVESMLSSPVEDVDISGQIGLRNVRQRLSLLYGEQGLIRLSQPDETHILARVSFPLSL